MSSTSPPSDVRRRERRGRQWRPALAGLTGLLTTVLLVSTATGWWSVRTLSDPGWVGPRVDALLADPVVAGALAERVVDGVLDELDVRSAVADSVPAVAEPLVGQLVAGVRDQIVRVVAGVITTDQVRAVVARASERAYGAAVDLVRGDGLHDGVRVVGDEVRLDLLPVVGVALEQLQALGVLSGVELPDLSPSTDVDVRRRALSEALGRELGSDFGELVVFRGATVEQAGASLATMQDLFVALGRLVVVSAVGATALAVATVWLAARRWRALAFIGIGLVLELFVLQLATNRLVVAAREVATEPAGRVVIDDLVGELQRQLIRSTWMVALISVAMLAVALLVADRRSGPGEGSGADRATDAYIDAR